MPEGMPPESYAGHEMFERAKELFSGLDEEGRMAARAGVEVALKQQEGQEEEEEQAPQDQVQQEEGPDAPDEGAEMFGKGPSDLPDGTPMLVVIRRKAAHKACPHHGEE